MLITRRALLAAALAGAVPASAAACAKETGGDDAVWQAAPDSIEGMLALLPDNSDAPKSYPTVNLYTKAAADAGIPRPTTADGVRDYLKALVQSDGPALAGSALTQGFIADPAGVAKRTGFGLADIDADADLTAAPAHFVAARGRFDLSAVDSALRSDPDWKSELSTADYDGTTVYRWLEDNEQDVSNIGAGLFTEVGGSRRFAFPDHTTFLYATTDRGIRQMLDASAAKTSLAANSTYAAAARALDGDRAYSAMFVPKPMTVDALASQFARRKPSAAQLARIRAQLSAHALAPYQMAAVGVTFADGHARVIAALVNPDAETAATNAKKLTAAATSGSTIDGRPWSQVLTVGAVRARGDLTVATFGFAAGTPAQMWPRLAQDTLLMSA